MALAARGRGHVERLVRPLAIEAIHERVEAHLLLEHVGRGGARGIRLQGEMHALVTAVLLGMAGRDALEPNAEA